MFTLGELGATYDDHRSLEIA